MARTGDDLGYYYVEGYIEEGYIRYEPYIEDGYITEDYFQGEGAVQDASANFSVAANLSADVGVIIDAISSYQVTAVLTATSGNIVEISPLVPSPGLVSFFNVVTVDEKITNTVIGLSTLVDLEFITGINPDIGPEQDPTVIHDFEIDLSISATQSSTANITVDAQIDMQPSFAPSITVSVQRTTDIILDVNTTISTDAELIAGADVTLSNIVNISLQADKISEAQSDLTSAFTISATLSTTIDFFADLRFYAYLRGNQLEFSDSISNPAPATYQEFGQFTKLFDKYLFVGVEFSSAKSWNYLYDIETQTQVTNSLTKPGLAGNVDESVATFDVDVENGEYLSSNPVAKSVYLESFPSGSNITTITGTDSLFGYSVALSKDYIIISTPITKKVYFYDRSTYNLVTTLTKTDTNYGHQVYTYKDRLVIKSQVSAYIHDLSDLSQISAVSLADRYGDVYITDDYIVIGDSEYNSQRGRITIKDYNGNTISTIVAELVPGGVPQAELGYRFAVENNYLYVISQNDGFVSAYNIETQSFVAFFFSGAGLTRDYYSVAANQNYIVLGASQEPDFPYNNEGVIDVIGYDIGTRIEAPVIVDLPVQANIQAEVGKLVDASADFAGAFAPTITANAIRFVDALFDNVFGLSINAEKTVDPVIDLQVATNLAVTPTRIRDITTAFANQTNLTVVAGEIFDITETFAVQATKVLTPSKITDVVVNLSGITAQLATGLKIVDITLAPAFAFNLSVDVQRIPQTGSLQFVNATLLADVNVIKDAICNIDAQSTLVCDLNRTRSISADLNVNATQTTDIGVVKQGTIALDTFAATVNVINKIGNTLISLDNRANLSVTATLKAGFFVDLVDNFTQTTAISVIRSANVTLLDHFDLTANGTTSQDITANFDSETNLSVTGASVKDGSATLSDAFSASIQINATKNNEILFIDDFALTVTPSVLRGGSAEFVDDFALAVNAGKSVDGAQAMSDAFTLSVTGRTIAFLDELIYVVPSESRTHTITQESREYEIPQETRTYTIGG